MADSKGFVVAGGGSTLGVRMPAGRAAYGRVPRYARSQFSQPPVRRAHLLIALVALAGVLLPTEVQISLGAGARFSPGRLAATLLLLPALGVLCQKGRRLLLCDFLAIAASAWMIVASVSSVGASAISAAGGDALDFFGGYLIARAYFFGRTALDTFIRVLKIFAIIAIVLAIADTLSGRMVAHEAVAALSGAAWYAPGLRSGWVRAASTFDHPILFGLFCALTAAILLYWEKSSLRRSTAVGICSLGCILSFSSAALMAILMILSAFTYDQLMRRYSWRWTVFWTINGASILLLVVMAEHPLNWIVSHLTFDPQTAYFRMATWETAFTYIAQSPMVGYAYQSFNNNFVDGSVDSVWLLQILRFGVPMFILFFLANVTAFMPGQRRSNAGTDVYTDRMRRAFTLVLLTFMFAGITVHFWNYMLTFWGLCLGIRASLQESS